MAVFQPKRRTITAPSSLRTAIPDYHYVAGNLDVKVFERRDGGVTHFIMLTYWENYDVIRSFAGKDINKAKYYPEDKDFLLEFEPTVEHYEVVGETK
ncbi:MAG: antibiotic biosynthesis monooxygenase [Anaerolineaceae bacterium]